MNDASRKWPAEWQPARFALDLVARAARNGLILRLVGSVAIRLRCETAGSSVLTGNRGYKDADLICSAAHYPDLLRIAASMGFESDRTLEVATEGRRLLLLSPEHPFSIDLFVDELAFCHRLVLKGRLAVDEVTVPVADLLLSKLQRVDPRAVDFQDLSALLATFPLGDSDGEHINVERITSVLRSDWGFCHTVIGNLDRIKSLRPDFGIDNALAHAAARSGDLQAKILAAPKTWRWKLRSLLGECLSWYEHVDAPDVF